MSATAQISGRLGVDPELRQTNGGSSVVNLTVANQRRVKNGDEREYVVDWYKVTLFGRDAEIIAEHARKGSALAFNGQLQMERYEDRDGNQRSTIVLVANSFEFLPSTHRAEQTAGGGNSEAGDFAKESVTQSVEDEDEIPF